MEKTEMSLADARQAAQKVYEQMMGQERDLLMQLDELRAQRYRQEGYMTALDQILAASGNRVPQENGNGKQEEVPGQEEREGREEAAPVADEEEGSPA